ncbi:cupin domain-containing protein [Nocardia sp. NPDC001965]
MSVIRSADRRRIETPNGTMSTLASPTRGGTADLAVWHVEFLADREGPAHIFDRETVWTILSGSFNLDLDGSKFEVTAGDTVVMPADVPRQMTSTEGFTAVVASMAGTVVYNPPTHQAGGDDQCDIAPKADERIPLAWAQ